VRLLTAVLLLASSLCAQTSAFKFDPRKVPAETWHHYTKSNLDGSHKGNFYIYVVDRDHIEVLKLEPEANDGVYIKARMDWSNFSETDISMFHIKRGDERRHIFVGKLEAGEFRITLDKDQQMIKPPFSVPQTMAAKVMTEPAHVYGFELIGLNLTMPHLRSKNGDVHVTLLGDNPKFSPDSPTLIARLGDLDIHHVGAMPINGRNCRLYRLSGPALDGKEGQMWVDKKTGLIARLESPKANNGDWNSLLLEHKESKPMSLDSWRAWVRDETIRHIAEVESRP